MTQNKKIAFLYHFEDASCLNTRSFFTFNMLYLAAVAESVGFEVKLFNMLDALIGDEIYKYNPEYLLADILIENFKQDIEKIASIKIKIPALKIILKGLPFLTYNTNFLYENPFVDYLILNEAEYVLKDILTGVLNEDIKGLCYLENYQGVKNELREVGDNLDDLPYPSRHLVEQREIVIETSRGCTSQCFECLVPCANGIIIRKRSVDSIIEEIKSCIDKFNVKKVYFKADVFNFDKAWVVELCSKIIKNKLDILWSAKICSSLIDQEMIDVMYKSGCREIELNVVSASQEILNNAGKKVELQQVESIIQNFKKRNIKICLKFLLGLPWETETTIEDNFKFIIKNKCKSYHFSYAIPYPGTKFFAYSLLNKLAPISGLSFENSENKPLVRSHKLLQENLEKTLVKISKKYGLLLLLNKIIGK